MVRRAAAGCRDGSNAQHCATFESVTHGRKGDLRKTRHEIDLQRKAVELNIDWVCCVRRVPFGCMRRNDETAACMGFYVPLRVCLTELRFSTLRPVSGDPTRSD
jgi:hypothetical protein